MQIDNNLHNAVAVKKLNDKVLECYESIQPDIYYAERLLSGFQERFFDKRPEVIFNDETLQREFVEQYEYMAAQVHTISSKLFDIRLRTEFVTGDMSNPIISAHIRIEDEMRSWLN